MACGDIPKCFDCGEYMFTPHINCPGLSFPKYDSYYGMKSKSMYTLQEFINLTFDDSGNIKKPSSNVEESYVEEAFPDYNPPGDYQPKPKLNPIEENGELMLADLLRRKSYDANVVQVNLAYDRMINLIKDEADEGYRESRFMTKALKLNQPGALDSLVDKLRADGLEASVIMKDCGNNGMKEQLVIKW